MVSTNSVMLVLGICSCLPQLSLGNAFLHKGQASASLSMTKADIQASLLSEIIVAMGPAATAGRLTQIEDALRPMFIALPKNEHGNLGHATVCYALHRLFVQRHGWYIKGLEPAGGLWNASSPTEILADRVPAYILELFEERMGGHGLNLHDVAVLASTLEHLVHDEARGRVQSAFKALGWGSSDSINAAQATDALETYMAAYIVGGNLSSMSRRSVTKLMANVHKVYPFWDETKKWLHQVQHDYVRANVSRTNPSVNQEFDLEAVTSIADKLGEGYGRFQNTECQQLKGDLIKHADRSTGRVKLSDFYKAALGGQWQFSETIGYLRELGALDESNPQDPSVVVPNYIGALSNCIATSAFYSVCCIDECEDLVGHLESKLAAPQAEPAHIANLVRDLPSNTVLAPRNLPAALLQRLDEIAVVNDGGVPLHGRLFAQWMHHAFPNECPYPHVSGTTSPRTAAEWMNSTGEKHTATKDEMKSLVDRTAAVAAVDSSNEEVPNIPWAEEEELLVIRSTFGSSSSDSTLWVAGRNMMFVVAFSAIVISMVRSTKAAGKTIIAEPHKMYV